ncbi:MAG: hypothetical protein SNJ54_00340 [Anaerolineae bacterium]
MIRGLSASLVNGRRWDGSAFTPCDLHIAHGRWSERPPRRAPTLDLTGALVLPTLVNAHDHLELNHYPRTRPQPRYTNAADWAQDVNALLDQPPYAHLRAHPYEAKAHAGLVKNVLSGVHWVIQHGRPHPYLFRRSHPIRVLPAYEWAHSVYLSAPREIQQAHGRATAQRRFFIHAAEGTDGRAADEIAALERLGCLDVRTVLIHGVGIPADMVTQALKPRGVTLIACPTTNAYLLGALADVAAWHGALAIGTDSRLTASGDLWDEVRALLEQVGAQAWEALHAAPATLGLPIPRSFAVGALAACTVIGPQLTRSDIRLVIAAGKPLWGQPDLMRALAVPTVRAALDNTPVALSQPLARWLSRATLEESGFTVCQPAVRRWW